MILNDEEAKALIEQNKQVPSFILTGRKINKEMLALVEGEKFLEELIKKIEKIEDRDKAEARKKYSRDIQDFYERISQPIINVFNATGGEKSYAIKDDVKKKKFLKVISEIRDNKSIQSFVENVWLPLFHVDPNGLLFLEYNKNQELFPSYKSIGSLRNYKAKGQLVEWVIFEPVRSSKDSTAELWRIVDDSMDRTFLVRGESIELVEELTFPNPFGQVPAIVVSNIQKIGFDYRLSDYNKIVPLSKEYARDQSIKTVYKFLQGMPKEWRYAQFCRTCTGTGKTGNKACTDCSGKGIPLKNDVTDVVLIPIPKEGLKGAPPTIAGHIKPDLETWSKYTEELELLEKSAYQTHWGTVAGFTNTNGQRTATEIIVNKQPLENRLNQYADVAEWIERQFSEWIINFLDPLKNKEDKLVSIHYGRRYIIDSPSVVLEMYQDAKEKGDNNTILDRLFNEYLTAKYSNNPFDLRINLLKASLEPYLHLNYSQVIEIFGKLEAQRKALFETWWRGLTIDNQLKDALEKEFNVFFEANKVDPNAGQPKEEL